MKILVTGGSGFIGKTFIRNYRKKFDIVAPTHEQMDLGNARAIESMFVKHKFDAVVHLAGLGEQGGVSLEADNLIMFKNIQYLSIVHGVKKLITVGEGVEFDRARPIVDFKEDMFGQSIPTDGYGLAKYLINLLASKDKITTVLRIFNVYGAGGGLTRPINRIVAAGSRGKKQIVIDRDRVVSAISVDDAARAIYEFLRNDYPIGDYNLVAADKMSYLSIAKTVKRLVKKDGGDIEIVVKNDGMDNEYSANNDKIVGVTNMRLTSMQTGIKKLYEELKTGRRSK